MYVFVLYILSLNLFWLKSKITDPGKQENTFAKKVVTEFASSCIEKTKTKEAKKKKFFFCFYGKCDISLLETSFLKTQCI